MKLAKGSNRRIDHFENHAHRQLQSTSLCSKLAVSNDITSECLYICNQNFDHRTSLHCVALSDDDWMLWYFPDYKLSTTDISNHVPEFLEVHHVRVTKLNEQHFLKCDCLMYHR